MNAIRDENKKMATTNDGLDLCKILHEKLIGCGFFPALTGGLLYKGGERKDIDIVIYRHRQQVEGFEISDISNHLADVGVEVIECYGFVTKAIWNGFSVDLFNPETKIEFNDEDYGG